MQALRELLALFDVEVNDKELKKADKSLDGLEAKVKHVMGIVGEVFLADRMFEFIKGTIEADSHLQELALRLDVSATQIRNFGMVAQDAGVDLESAANAVGLLQKNLGEAKAKGGEAAAAFAKLNIDLANPPTDLNELLAQVSDGLAALPDQNARAAASMQLFGRSGRALVPILSQGSEAFRAAMKDADALGNALGDQFYKDVKDAQDGYEHFAFGLKSLKDRALAALLPALADLGQVLQAGVKWLLDFDKKTHIVTAGMITLTAVIGVGLVEALYSAAAAAIPMLIEFAPLIGITLAVGGLIWVLTDLFSLMTGGTSVVGDFVERLGGIEAKNAVVAKLRDLWEQVKQIINDGSYALGYFFGILAGTSETVLGSNTLGNFFLGLIETMLRATRVLLGFIRAVQTIPKALKEGTFGAGIMQALGLGDGTNALPGVSLLKHSTNPGDYGQLVAQASNRENPALAPQGTRSVAEGGKVTLARLPASERAGAGPSVEQTNHNQITVHTASSEPGAVGEAVGKGVATRTQKDLNAALEAANKP